MYRVMVMALVVLTPVTKLADVPNKLRVENVMKRVWCDSCNKYHEQGSCVHVTNTTLLLYHGFDDMAAYWMKNYGGGELESGIIEKLEKAELKYAYTNKGDVKFLEWACRNRLAAGVFIMQARHCVLLVDLTKTHAVLLDNNSVDKYKYVTRESFLTDWRNSRGFAWTLVYPPPPPWPK